jgi:hypothetical protein
MANISITRRCRRHCSYCFAQHELSREAITDMPPEIYENALQFLINSGLKEVRLLGGEPTEHPSFCAYVARAFELGFRVLVFSGGLVPRPVLDYLAALPAEHFSLVLNVANPGSDSKALVNRQQELCRTLGQKVMLGMNIRSSNEAPPSIFDWVNNYNLCRTIRLGIAHPIYGGNNAFFRLRGPRALSVFEHIVVIAAEFGLKVHFDCGFTPCMFSQEFMDAFPSLFTGNISDQSAPGRTGGIKGPPAAISDINPDDRGFQPAASAGSDTPEQELIENRFEPIGVRCNSIVDILPEGTCIACYALSRFVRIPLPSKGKRNDLVSRLDCELMPLLPTGIYRECADCTYREKGMCNGGCRARRALRLRSTAMIPLDLESGKDV